VRLNPRSRWSPAAPLVAFCLCLAIAAPSSAQVTVFTDRTTFAAAIVGPSKSDDYEAHPLGVIALGDVRGDFRYTFDGAVTQPAVASDGAGGHALGGSPFDVLVGGDSVTLSAGAGSTVSAFGADFSYAPSFDTIPAGTYRLSIADGSAAGQFAGNLDSLDPAGGSFFLGIVADAGFEFTSVSLFSVQTDPTILVPAYQVDNLLYAGTVEPAAVPEPSMSIPLLVIVTAALAVRLRRAQRMSGR
jgi:hypothetical protein